ncbi:carbohydrate-binding protein [Cystobacter fuscus]
MCEAESAGLSGGARIAKDHNGYSGKGFAAGFDVVNSRMTVRAVGVRVAGTYSLQLRYARGLKTQGAVTVQAGTGAASTLTLPSTSDWDSWRTVRTNVTLPSGTSDVSLSCPQAGGCGVNVDTVALTRTDAPLLAPHAALGGYRRGLDAFDGNNGSAILNPGILYQDGWSLLDDTASAEYDPATRKLTPAPRTRAATRTATSSATAGTTHGPSTTSRSSRVRRSCCRAGRTASGSPSTSTSPRPTSSRT